MIKKVDCDDPKVQSLVSLLRSLDLFSLFSNHKLCKLKEKKTEENLCHFCLVRSLVLRCQGFKGRTSFKPNELLVVLKNEVIPASPISSFIMMVHHISSFIPDLMEQFQIKIEGQLEMKLSLPEGDNQDISTKVQNYLEKRKIEILPSVLLVECKSGFKVNLKSL